MIIGWFVLLIACCSQALAQPSAEAQTFEIASVRASEPGARGESVVTEPGKLTMRNVSLRSCIQWAYDVRSFQISGPGWLTDSRFDIAAKAAGAASDDRLRPMSRALLAERFGLRLHHERKELPVYVLTMGKQRTQLHESTSEGPVRFSGSGAILLAERASMSDVETRVSEQLGRSVVDKTGLTGRYDFRFDVTPYVMAASSPVADGPDVKMD